MRSADGNVVKLVGEKRSQPAGCALDVELKLGRRRLRLIGRELLRNPANRGLQIRALVHRGAQTFDGIATIGDSLPGVFDYILKRRLGLRPVR